MRKLARAAIARQVLGTDSGDHELRAWQRLVQRRPEGALITAMLGACSATLLSRQIVTACVD